jgi:RNA polymerase sigma-70 factor (ECF subfamily)
VDVDPLLVRAVQRGEPGAMDGFIRATYSGVYALAERLLDDPSDAADATQEVYLRVVRSVRGFRGSGTGAWLERLTTEICASALEARGAAHERGQSAGDHDALPVDLVDSSADPAALLEDDDLAARTAVALDQLPEPARTVVLLRDVQGLSTKQAAQQLGISEGAVKVRLHRAHATLREWVGLHER